MAPWFFDTVRMSVLNIPIRCSKVHNMEVRQRRKLLAVGEKKGKGIRRGGIS